MILMICATVIPSAAERSLTLTPDGTVTGPGRRGDGLLPRLDVRRGAAIARLAAVAAALIAAVDDDAALAPGGASARANRSVGLVGLVCHQLGRFPSASSVVAREIRLDDDGPAQHPVEAARRHRALEAREPPARVDAPAGNRAADLQASVHRAEAHELRLRRLATAARAGSLRRVRSRLRRLVLLDRHDHDLGSASVGLRLLGELDGGLLDRVLDARLPPRP